ncbi:MAG: hypothetical protein ABSC88_07135 [Terracidiphilus sp.]|jgi:hypothetical protein
MKARICCLLLLSASLFAQTSRTPTSTLKQLLAQQGFSGALEGKIAIKRLGVFHCGSRTLEVFYHSWEQSNPPGARHAAYRIIFLEDGNKYIGQYRVQDPPTKITRTAIVFDYPAGDGNIIECEGDSLPEEVLLNGESGTLFK